MISDNFLSPEVSGNNLVFSLSTDLIKREVSFFFHDWGTVKDLEKNYQLLKKQYENGEFLLNEFEFEKNINHFVNHLLYDLTKQLSDKIIDSNIFILKSYKIISECIDEENYQIDYHQYVDYYRLNNRYDLVFELINTGKITFDFSLIHDLEYNLKCKVLTGELLIKNLAIKSNLNKIIQDKFTEFIKYIDVVLNSLYSNNNSFYSAFYKTQKSVHQINKEFPMKYIVIESGHSAKYYQTRREGSFEFIKKNLDTQVFKKYIDILDCHQTDSSRKWLKNSWNQGEIWLRFDENPLSYINGVNSFFYYIENMLTMLFKVIVFNSQDDFRTSIGLPKIGQGWVSETNLFNAIKGFFQTEHIIQHASPKWLGRQHLDVYFTQLNIGIEYQGKQHAEPIKFFGGEEAHKKTIERDERKKQLCHENNCILLFVYPETNTDDFLLELESIVNEKK